MDKTATNQKSGKDNDSPSKDKLFDPSIDMLVNDYDDERTLEEEEALAAGESQDADAELSNLQKESNMPLEELLALYGYNGENKENESSSGDEEEITNTSDVMDDSPSTPEEPSKLKALYEPMYDEQQSSKAQKSTSRVEEEEDEDLEYNPEEDELRKTIMVGSAYQAQVPTTLAPYDDTPPYSDQDTLLWDPNKMEPAEVEEYLKKANAITKPPLPTGTQLRDDEQALYLLQQCNHNTEEALKRLQETTSHSTKKDSQWSEEECRNFESGVQSFGKNFTLIQQKKVRTRTVGELVQFYYLWKKSERHDIFASKTKLEKKKYAMHPGLTDFMDRFLEDNEGRDRGSSPSIMAGSLSKPPPDT